MNDASATPSVADRLEALAAFLPVFEHPDFSFGELVAEEGQWPWFRQSEAASDFLQALYQWEWVVPSIDWTKWGRTAKAQRLMANPEAVAKASVRDLERLLTLHARADHFNEDHLRAVYESGHLTAILRRADALLQEMRG